MKPADNCIFFYYFFLCMLAGHLHVTGLLFSVNLRDAGKRTVEILDLFYLLK